MNDTGTTPSAIRRRADGDRHLSSLTRVLVAASIAGTGAVVYTVGHTGSTTAGTGGTSTTGTTTTSTTTNNSGTVQAPTVTQNAPVATSHGS